MKSKAIIYAMVAVMLVTLSAAPPAEAIAPAFAWIACGALGVFGSILGTTQEGNQEEKNISEVRDQTKEAESESSELAFQQSAG